MKERNKKSLTKRGKLRTSFAPVGCNSPMRVYVVSGGGDRRPAGHPLMLFNWWGRSISVMARSGPEGGGRHGLGLEQMSPYIMSKLMWRNVCGI